MIIIKYMNNLATTICNIKQASDKVDISVTEKILIETSTLLTEAKEALEKLKVNLYETENEKDGIKRAMLYRNKIIENMEDLRRPIDKLELLVDSNLWPVPSYGDLILK